MATLRLHGLVLALLCGCPVGAWLARPSPLVARLALPMRHRSVSLRHAAKAKANDPAAPTTDQATDPTAAAAAAEEVFDVVVVGAGVGGLCCAGLAAKYGCTTLCLEAHDTPGGVAHAFTRPASQRPFRFDSGPSLLTGLSSMGTNPLRQVMDALEVADEVVFHTYDGWLVHDRADDQILKVTTGDGSEFAAALQAKEGLAAREAFTAFRDKLLEKRGLAEASGYIPPFALRGGMGAVASLARYTLKLLSIGSKGALLTSSFGKIMNLYDLQNEFVRKWFDYLAFALSGLDADHTQSAAVAYMTRDLHKKGAVLDYPMGGVGALVDALVKGVTKHGGQVRVNARVERFLLEDSGGKAACTGVVLSDGRVIRAKRGVVCNAPLWNMARILQDSVDPEASSPALLRAVQDVQSRADGMNMTGSFMHIHLGIPKEGLPDDLECHHTVLDFNRPIDEEQNMVIISIPTVFDPSLAPEGYHIVHAYTAACDSFEPWQEFMGAETGKVGVSPNTAAAVGYKKADGYQKLKDARAEVLWQAIERVIPDVRSRAKKRGSIAMVGTPLTHRRYNQRFRGTYGPAPANGKDIWELGGATTPIKGLLACGDTTFPGIGLPGKFYG